MPGVLELLNGSIDILIAIFCFYIFFRWQSRESEAVMARVFALLGFIFLIFGALKTGWGIGLIKTTDSEIMVMFTAFNIAKTIMLFFILHKIFGEHKIIYIFHAYWVLVMISLYSQNNLLRSVDFISFSLLFFVFLYIAIFANYELKKAGIIGLFYSAISLSFLTLMHFGINYEKVLWFTADILIGGILYFLYADVDRLGIEKMPANSREKAPKSSKTIKIAKGVVAILFIIAFSIISTVAIHEIGHALAGTYYDCQISRIVIYDLNGLPHTEIGCSTYFNEILITLAGILLTTFMGFVFMLMGLKFTNNLAYITIGFGLLIGHGDLSDLMFSDSILALIWLAGFIIMGVGIIKLSVYYLSGKMERAESPISASRSVSARENTDATKAS